MTDILLQVTGLVAGYKNSPVLRNVELTMLKGQVAGLIGPNGHGKSTLLRAISGMIAPTAGKIVFDGSDITGLAVSAIVECGVIHVPQGDLLFSEMSVIDNLLLGATRKAAARQIDDSLEFVFTLLPRLKERASQTALTLSGGERRMLAIGRGLMGRGTILMLDEPSLGLAPALIEEIYDVLLQLAGHGHSILLVEENATRAAEVSDRLSLMDHGQITWSGVSSEIADDTALNKTYFGT